MAKVPLKYQVTLPKVIADQYHIRPGDDIEWVPAGDIIRVIPPAKVMPQDDAKSRLRLFDQATARIWERAKTGSGKRLPERGWRREDLYIRGRAH